MTWLRTNTPPRYRQDESYQDNFDEFFNWALELRNPLRKIPQIGQELGFGMRRHPLGFLAVYLSPPIQGLYTPLGRTGLARANVYLPGHVIREDIHSHGFNFKAGVGDGILRNICHFPDWDTILPDGEGFVGYETSVDAFGNNHTVRATNTTVSVPRSEAHELQPGATYSLRPRVDFHSVEAGDEGAVTIFCKTATYPGQDGLAFLLRKPHEASPPENY